MAGTITWNLLRDLAGFRAARGRAVSVYLNLDPSVTPTAGDIATRTNSVLAEGERLLGACRGELSHDQREALKADLDRVARWLGDEFERDGAHGVAVFVSSLDGLWNAFGVPEAVEDEVKLGDELYLTPLVRLVGRGDGALAAFVGRERGQVFQLQDGKLVEIADASEQVPGRHDQGGWSQARYERHVEEIVARHLRRLADALERCVRRLPGAAVVLVTTDETGAEFDAMLANDVRAAVVGRAQAEAHATPAELLEVVAPVLERWRAGAEAELAERWRDEKGRDGRASAGWEETLVAASDGRVEVLLVQEGADRPAYRCPDCGRAQATGGVCPVDGAELEERPHGLDLAVHRTLARGGDVRMLRSRRDLEPVEGIGALLRF